MPALVSNTVLNGDHPKDFSYSSLNGQQNYGLESNELQTLTVTEFGIAIHVPMNNRTRLIPWNRVTEVNF
jgi:hypothetical protein